MHDVELLQRRLERERTARKEAESLLEQKSREVFQTNEELGELADWTQLQAEKIQAIVDTAAEGIVTFDESGAIQSFNPAAERIFGYSALEVVGRSSSTLLRSGEIKATAPSTIACNSSDGVGKQVIGVRKDGSEFPLELSSSQVQLRDYKSETWVIRDLTKRKQLESQLSHAQKMESVGQLAAGIAHEINTPIQYVGDNTRFLDDAFKDLENYLEQVEQLIAACKSGSQTNQLLQQITEAAEEADLEYLRDEVPQAIRQSLEGAERVAKIVRAMKEFSHPGVEEKSAIDLNKAIESTVTVSKNEWKYVSKIETDFDESLPLVSCFPGDLNQALLNLIVNAAHAIEKSRQSDDDPFGTITITTRSQGDSVEIRVRDSGTGIPVEARPKIFDPFFTTKPVGKGTGQGLAITYSVIVEKHGGTIHFETKLGEGTVFVIRLPLSQQRDQAGGE